MITMYLCRHAIAQDAAPEEPDADRPLTPEGAAKFRKTVRGFFNLIDHKEISHIFTSHLLRARQTAQIFADALDDKGRKITPQISAALGEQPDLTKFLKEIRALSKPIGIFSVGHEPAIGAWIGQLCFGTPGRITIKKAAIAAIQLAPSGRAGELLFLLQPGMLRHL